MVEATPPRAALVVVPTFNEAATIGEVIGRLHAADPSLHVLVVDDGSPDGTADLVERIGADRPGVFVLRRRAKEGLGQAYLAGFRWGLEHGYGAMVEMDADLSHDPGAAPGLVAALSGADLVIGSRYVPGGSIPSWSPHRRAISPPASGPTGGNSSDGCRSTRCEPVGTDSRSRWPTGRRAPAVASSRCPSASSTASRESPRCRCASPSRRSSWSRPGVFAGGWA